MEVIRKATRVKSVPLRVIRVGRTQNPVAFR
jgi:hypothetical protein